MAFVFSVNLPTKDKLQAATQFRVQRFRQVQFTNTSKTGSDCSDSFQTIGLSVRLTHEISSHLQYSPSI